MKTWLSYIGLAASAVAAHFPTGHAWIALRTSGKVMNGLLLAITESFESAWIALGDVSRELDYRSSSHMLVEWETALGLPDPCLPVARTTTERRQWIAFRLNKRRWNTAQDWHDLAALFGLEIRITPGWVVQRPALFESYFPKPFHLFPKLGRFRVYIDVLNQDYGGFPYDGAGVPEHRFPVPFGGVSGDFDQFRCMIERVKPANVLVIWNEFPAVPPHGTGHTFSPDFDAEFS